MCNTFDVNVLVNGNRCKQYNHEGITYVEAKDGSEWYFQIQNNSPGRVLAVCSVDGLNVLTGEKARSDDTGYIMDSYHSQKIKGFRFSDSEWALFKFGYKINGKTYAQSKGDGSEKNCGVIGVKLFYEKPKIVKYEPQPYICHCSGSSWANYAMTGGFSGTVQNNRRYSAAPKLQKLAGVKKSAPNFDMGTEPGKREKSKVEIIDFERGCEAFSNDIYYASRDSLIEMKVPITNTIKINNLPQSFPNRYCKMPEGWTG